MSHYLTKNDVLLFMPNGKKDRVAWLEYTLKRLGCSPEYVDRSIRAVLRADRARFNPLTGTFEREVSAA